MSHVTSLLGRRFRARRTASRSTTRDPGEVVLRFSPDLVERVQEHIASFEPERGGALLADHGVVRELIEDHAGRYSPVSWDISPELTELVGRAERAGLGVLAGTVHSHPDGLPDPSATDVCTTTHALEQNPHLDSLLICVVTRGVPRDTDLPIGQRHRMSIHVLSRTADGAPVLERGRGEVLVDGAADDGQGQGARPGQDDGFLPPEGDDALSRVRGLVGSLQDKGVVVAGCGSVGSRVAEDLVRSGVGRVVLIDPDEVSEANMARSVYTRADIGVPKVWALARRLRDISPHTAVTCLMGPLQEHGGTALAAAPDLLVLATDDMVEQGDLAARAYTRGVPQVSCALYRKAAAGEVCVVMPVLGTPCWGCAVGANQLSASERPATNYGVDTRLVAESGLGASVNLVASVASQAALAVLAGPGSVHGRELVHLLTQGRTFGIVTTVPHWPVLDRVLPGAPHQSHPRSLWPVVRRGGSCPVCGPGARRSTPEDADTVSGPGGDLETAAVTGTAGGVAGTAGSAAGGGVLEAIARELIEGAECPDTSWRDLEQTPGPEAGGRADELVH